MMNDTEKPTEIDATEPDTPVAEAGEAKAETDLDPNDPDTRVAVAEQELADTKDKLLRLAAEMENLRRRTAKDVSDGRRYAITGFARDVLGVGDNLRRALDAVSDEARAAGDATLTALLEGVEMTERAMLSVMEKHGVRRVEPKGEKFDPNLHQAMFEVPRPDLAKGTVVEVVQAGYVIEDRVLRPALVGVSTGGPKGEAEERIETASAAPASDAEPGDPTAAPGGRVDTSA